jgi:Ca2+-binding EF-hand superfamily protein
MRAQVLGLMMMAGAAQAEVPLAGVIATLPKAMQDDLLQAPELFEQRYSNIVANFGGAEGIDPAGIELYIAVTRAEARAKATARFLAADLDADGSIARSEVEQLGQTLSARQRGSLRKAFGAADTDADDRLSVAELRVAAENAAQRATSAMDAAALRSLPLLDLNKDGVTSILEVRQVALAAASAARATEAQALLRQKQI